MVVLPEIGVPIGVKIAGIALMVLIIEALLVGYFGEQDLGLKAFIQAVRWVMVGVLVSVAAELYLTTDLISFQAFILVIAIAFLFIFEYLLLTMDPDNSPG